METSHIIVWVIFAITMVYLSIFFGLRIKRDAKRKAAAKNAYRNQKLKYSYLKPGILDECPREEVNAAALFHLIRKEEDDFENYFENLNYSEKVVYGIYLLSNTLTGKNASIRSFFISPATQCFVPIIDEIFEEIGAHDIAELVRAARKFHYILENDLEDDEDDLGEYSRYNFSDFTNGYAAMVNSANINEKMTKYILEHKEDFYDENIPEEYEGE